MLIRLIYSTLCYFIVPLAFLRLLWRARHNLAYLQGWSQRLGFISPLHDKPVIWLHAVSVGETIAAAQLVESLLSHYPNYQLLITNGTVTGAERAKALFGGRVVTSYFPYDLFTAMHRFICRVRPKLVIVMETEIWPNCYDILAAKKIPLLLANARLSEKSFNAYKKYAFLFKTIWSDINIIAAQAKPDADRFISLGAPAERVKAVGNLKFNQKPINIDQLKLQQWQQAFAGRPVFIAASTHEGEETIVFNAYQQLRKLIPNLMLISVPRHPERVPKLQKQCEQSFHWPVVIRSKLEENRLEPLSSASVLIVDTLGELMFFYSLAAVAFIGGSLIDRGGHNILEPALLKVPIIVGPSMFNFAYINDLFKSASALLTVHNAEELAVAIKEVLTDDALRQKLITNASTCFESQQEALPNHLNIIKQLLQS